MKRIFQLAVILLAFVPAVCFAQHSEKKSNWAEMKAFHTLMSSTFHPAEEGNLVPLKEKAEDLLKAAKAWQKSEIPADFKAEETRAALKKLTIECGALHKAIVAQKPDEQLKSMITSAHNVFHTIVGECRKHD